MLLTPLGHEASFSETRSFFSLSLSLKDTNSHKHNVPTAVSRLSCAPTLAPCSAKIDENTARARGKQENARVGEGKRE